MDIKEKSIGWLWEIIKKAKWWLLIIWTATMPFVGWVGHRMFVSYRLDGLITALDARVTKMDATGTFKSDVNVVEIRKDLAVLKAQVADLHDWMRPKIAEK